MQFPTTNFGMNSVKSKFNVMVQEVGKTSHNHNSCDTQFDEGLFVKTNSIETGQSL